MGGKKFDMSGWGGVFPGVLNGGWTNIAFRPPPYGQAQQPADCLCSEPASSWCKVRGRQHDLNVTLLGSWTNYNKI